MPNHSGRWAESLRGRIVELALNKPGAVAAGAGGDLSTETGSYFGSEASGYRLLKAHDLITSPAFIVITAAEAFKDKTMSPERHSRIGLLP